METVFHWKHEFFICIDIDFCFYLLICIDIDFCFYSLMCTHLHSPIYLNWKIVVTQYCNSYHCTYSQPIRVCVSSAIQGSAIFEMRETYWWAAQCLLHESPWSWEWRDIVKFIWTKQMHWSVTSRSGKRSLSSSFRIFHFCIRGGISMLTNSWKYKHFFVNCCQVYCVCYSECHLSY